MEQSLAPRIIVRTEHPISRSLISPNALKVLYRLRDSGHTAYLVGGCVRDLLLGREPKDFDVATDATPTRIKRLFRNCRLVGRRFRLAHLHFRDEIIEVATFRGPTPPAGEDADPLPDGAAGSPRHPRHMVSGEGVVLRDNVFGTPAEDALRRDFTVNALAYDIADFSIIDYVGGVEDLMNGVIRTIGDPILRFTEDPVRMLRAVRFAALLGFNIEESTWRALLENAGAITLGAPPRLYEEVLKLFLSGEGESSYQLMRRGGLFATLFPGLSSSLEQEREGFPPVHVGRGLEWVDGRVAAGETPSQPLLLAMLFGGYLEERAAGMRAQGLSPQDALNGAVAELMTDQIPLVAIPHRTALAVREILAMQERFRKVPGKRPQSVLARHAFSDALNYLRFRCEVAGVDQGLLAWWERFSSEKVLPPLGAEAGSSETPRPGRRRRRRKSKPKPA